MAEDIASAHDLDVAALYATQHSPQDDPALAGRLRALAQAMREGRVSITIKDESQCG